MNEIRAGIVMGSDSDWPIMKKAKEIFEEFGIGSEARVLSAHRTPAEAHEWAATAAERGLKVLIAGAGGAAHLPGVVAASTLLPVVGVPIPNGPLSGFDALLAIVQMPKGIPVATVGVGRADNAALLAIHMMSLSDDKIRQQLVDYREAMRLRVLAADAAIQE
jgi:phosphoribosylaminoimidazole carboxylase PurE protein